MLKKKIDPEFGGYEEVKAILGREPPRHKKALGPWEKKGFPKAVMLGARTKVWNLALVRQYRDKLEAEANAPKKKGGRK